MMKNYHYNSAIGTLFLEEQDGALTRLEFENRNNVSSHPTTNIQSPPPESTLTPLFAEAIRQLDEYFAGNRRDFNLPLSPQGTPFQKRVWEALLTIPYGQTATYGQIAQAVGNGKAARAVGMANNRNPISIIIPCHRVIGADGSLVGYGGGLQIKVKLLELEGAIRKGL